MTPSSSFMSTLATLASLASLPRRLSASTQAELFAIQIARLQNGSQLIDAETPDLNEFALATLISFFRLLDRWDRASRSF
jgi:hypothetical protein